MKRIWLVIFALGFGTALMTSCNNENTADSEVVEDATANGVTEGEADAHAGHNHAPGEQHDHSTDDAAGANQVSNMPWTFLTSGVFHNNATITIGEQPSSNPNKGHWIDFKDNGTYEYGIYNEKQYDGSYYYDNEARLLQLHPRSDIKKSEWQVMHKDDNLILVGTSTYSDNATQMRFIRRNGYPQEK